MYDSFEDQGSAAASGVDLSYFELINLVLSRSPAFNGLFKDNPIQSIHLEPIKALRDTYIVGFASADQKVDETISIDPRKLLGHAVPQSKKTELYTVLDKLRSVEPILQAIENTIKAELLPRSYEHRDILFPTHKEQRYIYFNLICNHSNQNEETIIDFAWPKSHLETLGSTLTIPPHDAQLTVEYTLSFDGPAVSLISSPLQEKDIVLIPKSFESASYLAKTGSITGSTRLSPAFQHLNRPIYLQDAPAFQVTSSPEKLTYIEGERLTTSLSAFLESEGRAIEMSRDDFLNMEPLTLRDHTGKTLGYGKFITVLSGYGFQILQLPKALDPTDTLSELRKV